MLQGVRENVGQQPQLTLVAHGAGAGGVHAQRARSAEEVGVGVAHLQAGEHPRAQVAQQGPLGQGVVDGAVAPPRRRAPGEALWPRLAQLGRGSGSR